MAMNEYDDTPDVKDSKARVRVEVGHRVFVGDLNVPDEAFASRVSDIVNDPARRFLPLADVEALDGRTGQVVGRSHFVLVRLDAIDLILPLAEPARRAALD